MSFCRKCTRCNFAMPFCVGHFHKRKGGLNGLHAFCRSCEKERDKKRKMQSRLLGLIKNPDPEVQRQYTRKYRERHSNRVREMQKISQRLRMSNPQYRIMANAGRRVREMVENKTGSSRYLPFTSHQLKRRLEGLFSDGMNWDNYGEWHIDHIIPISSFNITGVDCEEFKKCWNLENLQPLWAFDNLSKGNKRPQEMEG